MKILKAYLYFYWDVLIFVSAIIQWVILTISVAMFAFISGIILDMVKRFKWNHEINRFEWQVIDWYRYTSVCLFDWSDGFIGLFH